MPNTSEKYKTDYYYKKENDLNPIVFIHGVGLTKEIWTSQIEFFKDHNVLVYDLIGHGKTPLEKKRLNIEDFTKQLLNLINEYSKSVFPPTLMKGLGIFEPNLLLSPAANKTKQKLIMLIYPIFM